MKSIIKRLLQLTLAVALSVSTMLIAIPKAYAGEEQLWSPPLPTYSLSLSMTVDKATAAPGDTVKYLITLTNGSNVPVTCVKFKGTAKLVNGFTPIQTLPEQVLDFGDFAVGQSKSLTYTQVIPSAAANGQFFDNFGYATGYAFGYAQGGPAVAVVNEGTVLINSNDASARTTIKVNIPEETTPAGDTDGTLVVTGEGETSVLLIVLGSLLLIWGMFLIDKARRASK